MNQSEKERQLNRLYRLQANIVRDARWQKYNAHPDRNTQLWLCKYNDQRYDELTKEIEVLMNVNI